MSLLDKEIQDYRIIWKPGFFLGNSSKADIESEDGKFKGKLKTTGIFSKKTILYDENNEYLVSVIKGHGFRTRYTIEDSNEKIIGNVSSKSFSSKTLYKMKNYAGKEILRLDLISRKDKLYEIYSNDDKIVASFTVEGQDFSPTFRGGIPDSCDLHIHDLDYNRVQVMGIFLSFLSSIYDYTSGG